MVEVGDDHDDLLDECEEDYDEMRDEDEPFYVTFRGPDGPPPRGFTIIYRMMVDGFPYVGQTRHALRTRVSNHLSDARRGAEQEVMRALRRSHRVVVESLAIVPRSRADEAEGEWVGKCGAYGPEGLNSQMPTGSRTRATVDLLALPHLWGLLAVAELDTKQLLPSVR